VSWVGRSGVRASVSFLKEASESEKGSWREGDTKGEGMCVGCL
jgi:hypothetical protein